MMPLFDSCPFCNRTEFKDSKSRDNHLYYERHKNTNSNTDRPQSKVTKSVDEEDIIDSFRSGELSVQDAVNEFQSQWEIANPQPRDGYSEWSAQRAKAVDTFRERLIRAKPQVSHPSQSQPSQPQISRQLSISEVAELRAMELRGEIPAESQSYQIPLFESEQPAISTQPQQTSSSQPQRPNIVESIKSAFSRLFTKRQPQIPERPLNEYGMPASQHQCITCGGAWLNNRGEVTIHLAEGHIVKYIPT